MQQDFLGKNEMMEIMVNFYKTEIVIKHYGKIKYSTRDITIALARLARAIVLVMVNLFWYLHIFSFLIIYSTSASVIWTFLTISLVCKFIS